MVIHAFSVIASRLRRDNPEELLKKLYLFSLKQNLINLKCLTLHLVFADCFAPFAMTEEYVIASDQWERGNPSFYIHVRLILNNYMWRFYYCRKCSPFPSLRAERSNPATLKL
jgi:hypothetical protein